MRSSLTLFALCFSFLAFANVTEYEVLYSTSFTSDAEDGAYISGQNLEVHADWGKANNPNAYTIGDGKIDISANWRGARLTAAPITPWIAGTSVRLTLDIEEATASSINNNQQYIGVTHVAGTGPLAGVGMMTGIKIFPVSNGGAMTFFALDGDSLLTTTDAETPGGSTNNYEIIITKTDSVGKFEVTLNITGAGITGTKTATGASYNENAYNGTTYDFALYHKRTDAKFSFHSLKVEKEKLAFVPLVANAGQNQTVVGGSTVNLTGTTNYDDNTDYDLTHQWYSEDGISLTDANTANASFTAETSNRVKIYSFGYKAVANEKAGDAMYEDSVAVKITINPADGLYANGSGTVSAPFEIENADHLYNLMMTPSDWNKNFKLINDINMDGEVFYPIGATIDGAQTYFTKMFDGNNHVIKNLTITKRPNQSTTYGGFFGMLSGPTASVKNLGLENVIVDFDENFDRVGAFAGQARWGAAISQCFVNGGMIKGKTRVGGITGYNGNTTITDCYVYAEVFGDSISGGLFGELSPYESDSIANVTFYGKKIDGQALVGVDLGVDDQVTKMSSAFYLDSCGATSEVGISLSAAELLVKESYVGFDFDEVWEMSADAGFAILKGFEDGGASLNTISENKMSIYPNPVNSILTVSETVKHASIFSLNGVLIKTVRNTSTIDVSDLASGMYLLRVDQGVMKFIKE